MNVITEMISGSSLGNENEHLTLRNFLQIFAFLVKNQDEEINKHKEKYDKYTSNKVGVYLGLGYCGVICGPMLTLRKHAGVCYDYHLQLVYSNKSLIIYYSIVSHQCGEIISPL